MTKIESLIQNLVRILDTDRPVNNSTILSSLIQLAEAVKELQDAKENNNFYEETDEEENGSSETYEGFGSSQEDFDN